MPRKVRDYKDEYKQYGSKPEVKKRRARNNKARRKMIREGKASVGDGKDVSHQDNNTRNNSSSNLKVVSQKTNRSYARNKNAGRKKK